MEKYQNKYNINTSRVQTWDYSSEAVYFITICTAGRVHSFGSVIKTGVVHSGEGKIAYEEWLRTFDIRKDMNVTLDEFVIMPDHLHAIIAIGSNEFNRSRKMEILHQRQRDAMLRISETEPLDPEIDIYSKPATNRFGPQSKNLASIVRGFKSAVTNRIKKSGNVDFAWQSGYHVLVIPDDETLRRFQQYTRSNPANWYKKNNP
jgi:putative transposase